MVKRIRRGEKGTNADLFGDTGDVTGKTFRSYCHSEPTKQESAVTVALFSWNHTTWDLKVLTVRSL